MHDVIVIGAGVMGSATAYHLARSGKKVLLLEQFEVGHKHGSSHGETRIFRFSYPETEYVEMAMESLRLWQEVEERSGRTLLNRTGGLDLGGGIEANANALEACGAQTEMMTGAEARGRFPMLDFPPNEQVLFSPDSGTVAAEGAWSTFVELAKADGAELREGTRVNALEDDGNGVRVETSHGTFTAPVAVVTAGGWGAKVLATAGIELPVRVSRETVAFFHLEAEPPTIVHWSDPVVYALPSPGQGVKIAQHIVGPTSDADVGGPPSMESVVEVAEWARLRYKGIDPQPHLVETCLYTNTADQRFILERQGNIVVGSPCSGHGFKFAPLIGVRLAALAVA